MKQREIKFRVWDSINKKMDPATYRAGEQFGHPSSCDLVCMQYAGIKDKNGKEIYEDDVILHGTGGLRAPGHVRWCEYSHGFKVFRGTNRYDIYAPEVIGNLHENPELLQP